MAESIPILEPLIRLLVEYLVPTIRKQVSYLCCYSCNVQELADEIPELTTKKQSVQQRVKATSDNLEVILPEVESWLRKVEELQTKSSRICNDTAEVKKSCLSKWCPPLHYRLSRQALKTTEASIKLRDTRFERIANPVTPADLPPIPAPSVIGFESRDSIENEIMDALKDKSVYLIGICGMGGIGKTKMAEKIENRAREKTEDSGSMFEKVGGNNSELCTLTPLVNFNFNFIGLQTLNVTSIHNFKSLFPPSILGGFTNLQSLIIEDCSTLEEVIGKEENVGETKTKRTLFPQLTRLKLSRLPKILAFCHNMVDLELPLLKELYVNDCPMMETFVKGISKHAIQSFFSKEVFCTKLKTLKLEKLNIAGIFCHNIPVDYFCGLEILTIRSCHKMSNLFSPVIFRGLTNLRWLDLEDCEELQEVIAKEDDQEGTTNIKETLSPRLFSLSLIGLPKMQRFCHMNSDLEFPSLQYVTIRDCPMLEIFSLGPLHLPRFKYLYGLEDHDFAAKLFLKKEKSSDEIHSENNCFTLSPRDLSITMDKEGRLDWPLARDSSDSFVTAAEVQAFSGSLEIRGKFEIVKLLPGIAYEILFMVMVDEDESRWEKAVDVQLTLPGGIEQHRTEILDEKRRDECIEMLVAEFTREPHQIGQLEFSLSAKGGRIWWLDLGIKGVRIRVKG